MRCYYILSSPFPEVTDDACLPRPLSVHPASTDPPHLSLMPTASGTESRGAAFMSWPAVYVDTEGRRHAGIVSQVGGVRSGDGRRFNSIEAARVIWLEGPSVWFDRRVGTPPTLICLPLLGSLGSSPAAASVAQACCPPLPYFAFRPSLLLHTVCHPGPCTGAAVGAALLPANNPCFLPPLHLTFPAHSLSPWAQHWSGSGGCGTS